MTHGLLLVLTLVAINGPLVGAIAFYMLAGREPDASLPPCAVIVGAYNLYVLNRWLNRAPPPAPPPTDNGDSPCAAKPKIFRPSA